MERGESKHGRQESSSKTKSLKCKIKPIQNAKPKSRAIEEKINSWESEFSWTSAEPEELQPLIESTSNNNYSTTQFQEPLLNAQHSNDDHHIIYGPSIKRDLIRLNNNIRKTWKGIKYSIFLCLMLFLPSNMAHPLPIPIQNYSELNFQIQNLTELIHQEKEIIRQRRDIACLYGYSSTPKLCDEIGDIAQFFFNPIGAIIDAIHGEKYQDSTQRYHDDNKRTEEELAIIQSEIDHYFNKTLLLSIPSSSPSVYIPDKPPQPPSTPKPYTKKKTQWYDYLLYLRYKKQALTTQLAELKAEDEKFITDFRQFTGQQPNWFTHKITKRDTKTAIKKSIAPIAGFLTIKRTSILFFPITALLTIFSHFQ